MKKFIVTLLTLLTIVGCTSYKVREAKNVDLPKYSVIGLRNGIITLKNGKKIIFTQGIFTCNPYMIRVQTEFIHFTILWANVKKIYLKCPY